MKATFSNPRSGTRAKVVCAIAALLTAATSTAGQRTDALDWKHQDIGAVHIKGEAQARSGVFTVKGAGSSTASGDALHYMFVPLAGDGELTATLAAVSARTASRVGLCLRESAEAEAAALCLFADENGNLGVRHRVARGAASIDTPGAPKGALTRMRVVREGARVSAMHSSDGNVWTPVFSAELKLPPTVLLGLAVTNGDGGSLTSAEFNDVSLRAPFGGRPFSIPGIIEAEDFDIGGPGVSYQDSDKGNNGANRWPPDPTRSKEPPYRDVDVDIAPRGDGSGFYVGWTKPAEWTEYSIVAAKDDAYRFVVRVASMGCGGTFHVEVDGIDKTGPLYVPNTDSWDADWVSVAKESIPVAAGRHRLRLVMDTLEKAAAVGNFDSIQIVPMSEPAPASPHPALAPSRDPAADLHPRLLIDGTRLEQIRQAIRVPGSFHQQAFAALKARIDAGDWHAYLRWPEDNSWNTARTYLAEEAAFAYLVTEDVRYADLSYRMLDSVYTESDPQKVTLEYDKDSQGVLTRSGMAQGFALSYDWCFKAWSAEQRDTVRKRIDTALDVWPCVGHAGLHAPYQRWIVPVVRGAELLLILSLNEESKRAERVARLREILEAHTRNGYGGAGFAADGLASAERAGTFLAPVSYAVAGMGGGGLSQRPWWQLLMFAHPLSGRAGYVQNGDDGADALPQRGWGSLLLNSVPAEKRPYFLWFYDRLVGTQRAPEATGTAFEGIQGGTVWALLYYPETVKAADPTGVLPTFLEDRENGAFYFRNRWRDEDDILISALADAQSSTRQPENIAETFDLAVIAFGRRFAASHGADKPAPHLLSTLLVDGQAYKAGTDTGSAEFAKGESQGGYVILDGGSKYRNLGLAKAKRHVLVDFAPGGESAILTTLDRLESVQSHIYTWQLNLGDERGDGGIRATSTVEDGVSTFLLTADNGAYLKGWVMSAGAVTVPDDPMQVSVKAANTDIWIAMALGKGTPPRARIAGSGLAARFEVNDRRIRFDTKTNRLVLSKS